MRWWAWLGVAFTTLAVYVWGAWLLSGPTRTPPGPTPIPTWMQVSVHIQLAVGFVAMVLVLHYFLVRPWRREGTLTLDGMIILGFLVSYWQDPLMNSIVPYALYNSYLPNWGSWAGEIPWWHYPNGSRVVEPILWDIPVYIYALFLVPVLGCTVMRKCKARWPGLSKLQLIGICYAFMAFADLLIEPFWIRTGVFVFNGVFTPTALTLFDGHWYQFPLSEPILLGFWWTTLACLRYFKNDKGEILCERGVRDLPLRPRAKTRLRLFAVIGAVNLALLVCYSLPASFLGLYVRGWPEDVYSRSYYTNTLCGPGTTYACPAPGVPLPDRNSAHLGPDGRLVVPEGTKLPDQR